jgi:hypothetical protein
MKTQQQIDSRLDELHGDAHKLFSKLEKIIDEMKKLGPHSLNRDNAILNTRQWLKDLSQR